MDVFAPSRTFAHPDFVENRDVVSSGAHPDFVENRDVVSSGVKNKRAFQ